MNTQLPFNIELLSNDVKLFQEFLPVQSLDMFSSNNEFHPQGLYSTAIFGNVNDPIRMKQPSFIDMRVDIMHPKVFNELSRLKGLYGGIISGTHYAIWNEVIKDFEKSDILDGTTGYSFFLKHFKDIDLKRNESIARDLRIKFIQKYKDRCMYRYLYVIAAGFRDLEIKDGRPVEHPINQIYRKIMRAANSISIYSNDKNSAALDSLRNTEQKAFCEIYDFYENLIRNKSGFLQDKYAKRSIQNGTRNVITSMTPTANVLGSESAITIKDTIIGLHQYMKGTIELTIYCIKNGPMSNVIQRLPGYITGVNPKTLKKEEFSASQYVLDNWGSEEGIEKLVNGYEKLPARHNPIIIDNRYAALLYRDKTSFKVFYDIDELPEGFNKENVKPLTWTEMFYLSVYETAKTKVAGYNTRYPITNAMGSVYPSLVHLRTTLRSECLRPLNEEWQEDLTRLSAIHMPILNEPHFDSLSIHPSKAPGLSSDHDGDKMSFNMVVTEEANEEIRDFLHSKKAFIDPAGGLMYGANNFLLDLILHNLTIGAKE